MRKAVLGVSATALVLALLLVPAAANAKDEASATPKPTATPALFDPDAYKAPLRAQLQQMRQQRHTTIGNPKADPQQKLDAKQVEICQNNLPTITSLMDAMNQRRQSAFDRITQILTAVKDYRSSHNLPEMKYQTAVADAAKTIAQETLTVQRAVPRLSCDSDHPRADLINFNDKRINSVNALYIYRDAVQSLIKAIRTSLELKDGKQ